MKSFTLLSVVAGLPIAAALNCYSDMISQTTVGVSSATAALSLVPQTTGNQCCAWAATAWADPLVQDNICLSSDTHGLTSCNALLPNGGWYEQLCCTTDYCNTAKAFKSNALVNGAVSLACLETDSCTYVNTPILAQINGPTGCMETGGCTTDPNLACEATWSIGNNPELSRTLTCADKMCDSTDRNINSARCTCTDGDPNSMCDTSDWCECLVLKGGCGVQGEGNDYAISPPIENFDGYAFFSVGRVRELCPGSCNSVLDIGTCTVEATAYDAAVLDSGKLLATATIAAALAL